MSQLLFPADPFGMQDAGGDPRKAALLLHAMGDDDRRWVLSQLPEAQRESLQALLAELGDLGIPADRALLGDILAAPSSRGRGAAPQGDAAYVAALEAADAEVLAGLLAPEPASLVAQLMELHAWSWGPRLMDALPSGKAREVQELRARRARLGRRPGGALRTRLLAALHARLAAHPSALPAPALAAEAPGLWARLQASAGALRRRLGS